MASGQDTEQQASCDRCGCCCRGRAGTVPVDEADVALWRHKGKSDWVARLVPGHFGCQGLPTNESGDCEFLHRTGTIAHCTIYALRPGTCAQFQADSAQCREYRRRGGRE